MERPSVKMYRRIHPTKAHEIAETTYEFGYLMGFADASARLEPLSRGEDFGFLLGDPDLADGYTDGYEDVSDYRAAAVAEAV